MRLSTALRRSVTVRAISLLCNSAGPVPAHHLHGCCVSLSAPPRTFPCGRTAAAAAAAPHARSLSSLAHSSFPSVRSRSPSPSPSFLSSAMSSPSPATAESWQKLTGLIEHTKFTMMATVSSADGTIRSRPMATQHVGDRSSLEPGTLWFFTQRSSHKVEELRANPQVNLGYIGQGETLFISVSGTAELVVDEKKNAELWNPVLKAWFPKGLDDPELSLLRVRATQAEYWDNTSNKLVQLFGYAKAALTGEPHRGEGQDHEKISLQ